MAAYRVLVSHRDLKMKTVVHLEPTTQVQYLVDAGYLRLIEEVQHVAGTESGNVDSDPVGSDVPRRRRKTGKSEVTDEPSSPVPDGSPADSEG